MLTLCCFTGNNYRKQKPEQLQHISVDGLISLSQAEGQADISTAGKNNYPVCGAHVSQGPGVASIS